MQNLAQSKINLGPIEVLLDDISLTDILINGSKDVFVEKNGKLEKAEVSFESDEELMKVIFNIARRSGVEDILREERMVDMVLWDGSRMNVVLPPIALNGPLVSIRKYSYYRYTLSDLMNFGSITSKIAKFLAICVKGRKNIIIGGGTGAGKTTLLNIIGSYIPGAERIVLIEDFPEVNLNRKNVASMQVVSVKPEKELTLRDLVKNALRMRPDRIIIGETRGPEALDLLQAMNTGHLGSITTIHTNSSRDLLYRLETLCMMAGLGIPIGAIRKQIASAIDVIVLISRLTDGSRKIIQISEVSGMEGDIITLADIFIYKEGRDTDGKITGNFIATGYVPSFWNELRESGFEADMEIFSND